LRLLRDLAEDFVATRAKCLQHLREGQPALALEQARRCFAQHVDHDTQQLLAVCELLNANWAAAGAHARQLSAQARRPAVDAR
jgi:hypothetical protein